MYTPLVCGVAQSVITGVTEGVGATELRVGRQEQPDRCCGVVTLPSVEPRPVEGLARAAGPSDAGGYRELGIPPAVNGF